MMNFGRYALGRRDEDDEDAENEVRPIPGERQVQVSAPRRQSRLVLMSVLGVLLVIVLSGMTGIWIYRTTVGKETPEEKAAKARAKLRPGDGAQVVTSAPPKAPPKSEGPPEPPPSDKSMAGMIQARFDDPLGRATQPASAPAGHSASASQPPAKSPRQLALERKLTSPLDARSDTSHGAAPPQVVAQTPNFSLPNGAMPLPTAMPTNGLQPGQQQPDTSLAGQLRTTAIRMVEAEPPPDRAWTLPAGTLADCKLVTATDSTLAGLGLAELSYDLMSEDGYNRLAEAGSKILIEQRAGVRQGQDRMFLAASRMITTMGVRVPLASPLADELGRPGMGGDVNKHWWDKLGGAIILTGVQAVGSLIANHGINSGTGSTNIVLSPQNTQAVVTEMVKDAMTIQNTITVPQAARCQIFIANDIDFRKVYALQERK